MTAPGRRFPQSRLRDPFVITMGLALLAILAACALRDGPLPVSKLPRLHGLTENQVIAQLGPPERTSIVHPGEGEFRIELYNVYPRSDAATPSVDIRELWWPDGDYTIVVWFHKLNEAGLDGQWIALDSCRWHKSIRF
jgi:hypothetical protein